MRKTDAYSDLADHVNSRCGTSWTRPQAEARYTAMVKKYKETRTELKDNGGAKFGRTDEEIRLGITIEGKVKAKCPGYYRLELLYGHRSNINPRIIVDSADSGRDDVSNFVAVADGNGIETAAQEGLEVNRRKQMFEEAGRRHC